MDGTLRRVRIASLVAGWLGTACIAAPRVDALEGALVHGAESSVRGDGFGTGSLPLVWDDFERGEPGGPVVGEPRMGRWRLLGKRLNRHAVDHRHSGNQSLHAARSGTLGQWANLEVDLPDRPRFYQSFWFRYRYPGTQGNTKLAQVQGDHGVGDHTPGVMTGGLDGAWWGSYIALERSGMHLRGNYGTAPAQDAWHHVELILQQSTPDVADGSVLIRVDGDEVYRRAPVKTRELAGRRWVRAGFLAGMTNFAGTTETWIDDVYASGTWARVELCEDALHERCKRKQIQPAIRWRNGRIDFFVNTGDLRPGQAAWLHVIDADGTATAQGLRVTVGAAHP